MAREPIIVKQLDAVQMKIEPEGRLTLNSKMLPEITEWQTGEKYKVKIIDTLFVPYVVTDQVAVFQNAQAQHTDTKLNDARVYVPWLLSMVTFCPW